MTASSYSFLIIFFSDYDIFSKSSHLYFVHLHDN